MTRISYLRAMFATCMLFQAIYVLCVIFWLVSPALRGHAVLPAIFPNFTFLTAASFAYGHIASMIYGWVAAAIFVFFYNVWPSIALGLFGQLESTRSSQNK